MKSHLLIGARIEIRPYLAMDWEQISHLSEGAWITTKADLTDDRKRLKHEEIMERSLELGGRRDSFLGTRECVGYIEAISKDEFRSLQKRFESYFDKKDTDQEVAEKSCQYWMDVRSFGQVITYQNRSIGLRGPVSITMAKSVEPIIVSSMQITRSTNGMEAKKEGGRSSDTMGMKHYVEHATYVIKGSISPNLAEVTGFTEEDAEYIKQALLTLFENDQSSARPDGSMTVRNLYWFTHSNKLGNASSARVYDLVHFDEATDEFIVNEDKLSTYVQKGLKLDLIEGF